MAPFTTSGLEMEWAYSYSHGAQTGQPGQNQKHKTRSLSNYSVASICRYWLNCTVRISQTFQH